METIKEFEELIGASLPEDYKKFLIKDVNDTYKRGMYVYENMDGQSRKIIAILKKFLTLEKNEEINLFNVFSEHKHELPKGVVPIATNATIDYTVISLNKKDYGCIYHWSYKDEPEIVKRPSYKNMYLVANSFTEFVKSIEAYEKTSLYIRNKIGSFGHKVEGRVPDDFEKFMTNEDINSIHGKSIDFIDNYDCEETALLHYVYGFKENQNDIIKNYEAELDENTVRGIVPFAQDEGGNLICICLRFKDAGKIYFIDHEVGLEDEDEIEELPVIANSFTEFLEKLYD